MVVPEVPSVSGVSGNRQSLSPITISSFLLLPSCSLGTADAGASGPGKSPILVSDHFSSLVSLLLAWEPDFAAGSPAEIVSCSNFTTDPLAGPRQDQELEGPT